jgi:hypothetical protein
MSDTKKPSPVQALISLAVFGGLAWYFFAGGIQDHVADNMIADYRTAEQTGDAMQMCVHASMVVAAYIQANDAERAKTWQATERADCEKAGVPRP